MSASFGETRPRTAGRVAISAQSSGGCLDSREVRSNGNVVAPRPHGFTLSPTSVSVRRRGADGARNHHVPVKPGRRDALYLFGSSRLARYFFHGASRPMTP